MNSEHMRLEVMWSSSFGVDESGTPRCPSHRPCYASHHGRHCQNAPGVTARRCKAGQGDKIPTMNKPGAIVLAGGRSSRMGADKAGMPWGGATMLERIVARLSRGFADVVVVAGVNQGAAVSASLGAAARVVTDIEPFEGPVGALRLGLDAVHADVAFACACDLPFLNIDLALALCQGAANHDAAIPLIEGRPQVLHAAYRKSSLPALDAMIARGARKLLELAPLLDVRALSAEEIRRYDPELLSFFNVNTPEDYARALRLAGKESA